MKWIIKHTGKYIWAVALLCAFIVLLTLSGVVQVLAMRNFLDFAAAGDKAGFLHWFAVYFGLVLLQLIGGAAKNLIQQHAISSLYNKVSLRYLDVILTREYSALRGRHSGEIIQMISSDTNVVVNTIFSLPMEVCSLITQLVSAILCFSILQGKLALLLLACFVLMLVAGFFLRSFVRRYHKRVMEAQGKVSAFFIELLSNLLVIRTFQATEGVEKKAYSYMHSLRKIVLKRVALNQAVQSGSSAAVNAAYIIGMLWCGVGMVNGTVSFGTFSAIWQLIGRITSPAMQILGIMPQYYTMSASAERLQELEKIPEEKADPTLNWKYMGNTFSQITCEGLSFSYDSTGSENTKVLQELNITVNRGDVIAITGESGIGKSTFLKLLLGIYRPEKDAVYVSNPEGERYVLDSGARTMISYVPQGNNLMSGTIREAVHFWQNKQIDEAKMREACRIAEAEGFISGLKQGYDTVLEEGGAGLSEGQLQRLAIARAIYSDKPVLLLDEATSALDEQTEARVLRNLKELKNRTVIIVTHRKAALEICNRIVQIENGKMLELP